MTLMMKYLFQLLFLTISEANPTSNTTSTASTDSWLAEVVELSNTTIATTTTTSNVELNTSTSSSTTTPFCMTRRCLASVLIDKEALSQPQSSQCISIIRVPSIVYSTLSVDIKNFKFKCSLQITLSWEDPDLSWDTSVYQHDTVVLPVSKIWTPDLHVANGLETTTKPGNQDLLVYSNGTVEHMVIMNTVVGCEVNLYNYPFASDKCVVAINGWAFNGCGILLELMNVSSTMDNSGDWVTEAINLKTDGGRSDRNYLLVSLKMRPENQIISLLLPSLLLILGDVASYALPLGHRITFKVKLILTFVMFLNLLTNLLPGGSKCIPIMENHFALCLVIMVLSTMQSMVLTRLDKCGTLLPCSLYQSKDSHRKDPYNEEDGDEESKSDISFIKLKASKEEKKIPFQKVVKILEEMGTKDQETARSHNFANKVDMICFCIYITILIVYAAAILYLFFDVPCQVNHLQFWH
ncbi:hypothetical protein UPYG_G00108800 [Umbra pygmaea]|uniref:Neurotransmitter-gated ion-channel ligand-binding domain-containing protein n=1 Tax=Umbra pygmaea TaxID=75934 RepID=A0ABD0X2K8_UMBPY